MLICNRQVEYAVAIEIRGHYSSCLGASRKLQRSLELATTFPEQNRNAERSIVGDSYVYNSVPIEITDCQTKRPSASEKEPVAALRPRTGGRVFGAACVVKECIITKEPIGIAGVVTLLTNRSHLRRKRK